MTTIGLTAMLVAGCGGTAYLNAANQFATATSTSVTTLAGIVDFGHRLCARRERLDYLAHRLGGTNVADGGLTGTRIYWSDWFTGFKPAGDPAWVTQCKATRASDPVVGKALAALSTYAGALATLAGADYSGSGVDSLTTDVDSLIGKIPALPVKIAEALKPLGTSAAGTPGAIGQLAGALKAHYTARQIREIVKQADPSVQLILTALQNYVAALAIEETAWEDETRTQLSGFDERLPNVPGSNPIKPEVIPLMELTAFAERRAHDIATTRTAQAAIVAALGNLTNAEQALVAADGNNQSPDLAAVLNFTTQLLNNIAAVRTAMQ